MNGVLFRQKENRTADSVIIAITDIHGNYYSNPFYYNIGDTLNRRGIDFIYAQTSDAFGEIQTINVTLLNSRHGLKEERADLFRRIPAVPGPPADRFGKITDHVIEHIVIWNIF